MNRRSLFAALAALPATLKSAVWHDTPDARYAVGDTVGVDGEVFVCLDSSKIRNGEADE